MRSPIFLIPLFGVLITSNQVLGHSFLRSKSSDVITQYEGRDRNNLGSENGGRKGKNDGSSVDDVVGIEVISEWENIVRDFSGNDGSALLIRSPHLINRSEKRDCHELLSDRVEAVCGTGRDSEKGHDGGKRMSDENDRISIAISLTLCSIASLNQRGPVECDLWSPFYSESHSSHNLAASMGGSPREFPVEKKAMEKRGGCLQALHRSPQDWSSYNGYLNEATKLCHSLESTRRSNVANAIYLNITLEKLALLKMMNTHERMKREGDESMERRWDEKLEDLQRTTESLHTDGTIISSLLFTTITSSHSLLSALSQALEEITRGGKSFWDEMRQQRSREMEEASEEMRGSWRTEGRAFVDDLATGLSLSLDKLSMATSDRVAAFENSLAGVTSRFEAHGRAVLDDQVERQDAIGAKWQEVDLVGNSIAKRLVQIDDQVAMLPSTLKTSVNMANELHAISHKNALQETAYVAMTLQEALVKSATEASDTVLTLQDIKAELLQDRWRSPSSWGFTSWLFGMVFSPLSLVASGPTALLPIVKILGYTLDVILGLLGTVLYIATSLWLVLRTGAWRLLRGAARLAYDEYWKLREEVSQEDTESRFHSPQHRHAILPPPSKAATTPPRRFVTDPLPVRRTHHDPHHDLFIIARKPSRGMQLDRLARRAQSEPL